MWTRQNVYKSDMVDGRVLQSPLMADRSGALTCNRRVGCHPLQPREHRQMDLKLPLSYGSCYFPSIPAPQELLNSTWILTRPAEYIRHLQSLMAAWRTFVLQSDTGVRSVQPSTSSSFGVNRILPATKPDSKPCDLSPWSSTITPTITDKNGGSRTETRHSSSSDLSPTDSLPSSIAPSPPVAEDMSFSPIASSTAKRYRKARVYFQPKDLSILENFYKKKSYLSGREREILAQQLGITEDRIKTWFQNRRMREKRKVKAPSCNHSQNGKETVQ